jgi:hypothetical protein
VEKVTEQLIPVRAVLPADHARLVLKDWGKGRARDKAVVAVPSGALGLSKRVVSLVLKVKPRAVK